MNKSIIGREVEQEILQNILDSKRAEFVAIYGRRRVGKTHLIRMFYQKKSLYIQITGLKDGSLSAQLTHFASSLSKVFADESLLTPSKNWQHAFETLTDKLETITKKIIFFIDELPWLATKRSGVIQALDYFWNTRWSQINNFKLIVCGSAASWMLENLIHAKGGLYNRLTKTIFLQPFNLKETKKYCHHQKIKLNNKQITDIYMVMGGIPHYLNQLNPSLSAIQNINNICFIKDGLLYHEFSSLFGALFDHAEITYTMIRLIANKHEGIDRTTLLKKLSMLSGGRFNAKVNELIASNFIQGYIPYSKRRKNIYFRMTDLYSLFYLKWIDKIYKANRNIHDKNYWEKKTNSPGYFSWSGYAFEIVCLNHVEAIAHVLGLDHISYEVGSWRYIPKKGSAKNGTQIDLLFDRADGIITICEIKYTSKPYILTKNDAKNLANKLNIFSENFKTNKQLSLVLISSMGMKKSIWSEELIDQVITVDDLFY